MIETKLIKVQIADGTTKACKIEVSQIPICKLVFSGPGFETREFTAQDLFEALVALRRDLEKLKCKPLCVGARIDVFPSGMSRSMGGSRKVYKMRLGSPALISDLLDIFEYAEPESVGSVGQQSEFHAKWVESLKLRK